MNEPVVDRNEPVRKSQHRTADVKRMMQSSRHQFRSVRIMVITSDCLSDYGGSIPPQTAKLLRDRKEEIR